MTAVLYGAPMERGYGYGAPFALPPVEAPNPVDMLAPVPAPNIGMAQQCRARLSALQAEREERVSQLAILDAEIETIRKMLGALAPE